MMQLQDAYAIIVTDKLAESRDFYTRWLGFHVALRGVLVRLPGVVGRPPVRRCVHGGRPSLAAAGARTFTGRGMFLTLQVADAAAEFARLSEARVPMAYALRDEPWGQRRFALLDPAGMWVDVVQHIEAEPGYWEQYMRPSTTA